jgi:uncharacterized protein YndB with AHSA1/START domain
MSANTRAEELTVRRSIEIDAAPERVWEEIGDPERFRLWYTPAGGVEMPCKRVEYEPRVGGNFETFGGHDWGSGWIDFHFSGSVVVYDPPRELTVSMKAEHIQMPAGGACLLSFLLEPLEGGKHTRMSIVQRGFETFGEMARAIYEAYESGWDMTCPTALRNLVETGRATG